jgi:hypothetical protein
MASPTAALQLITKYKYFQAEYYRRALQVFPDGFSPGRLAVVSQIAKHEAAHVVQLRQLLGADAPAQPAPDTVYDYSAGAGTGTGPFAGALDPASVNRNDFFKLAQLIEDFGLRVIKGQLPDLLTDPNKLAIAAQLNSVEGRHASEIRVMRGGTSQNLVTISTTAFATNIFPWITNSVTSIYDAAYTGTATDLNTQSGVAALVYGLVTVGADRLTRPTDSESNPSQRGYAPASAEAFDEPVATAAVETFLARFGVV